MPAPLVPKSNGQLLRDHVRQAVETYLHTLDTADVTDLYQLVLAEIEAPLLQAVLDHTRGNKLKAAKCLGLSRGTFSKKLTEYDLV